MTGPETSSDRILTIPNLVSFIRLLGVGVFWWVLLVPENIGAAAWLIFIIGWTDWIDGYLARRLNQVSELGKALDPIADRLMIVSAVVGGLIVGVVPGWIGIPLLIREAIMAIVALVLVSKGGGTLPVRKMGKWATFIIYGSIPSFYLAGAGFMSGLFLTLGWISGVIGLVLYWYVMVQYIGDARKRLSGVESPSNNRKADEEN
jgi:cardiolipin synthase (CMP-forming)